MSTTNSLDYCEADRFSRTVDDSYLTHDQWTHHKMLHIELHATGPLAGTSRKGHLSAATVTKIVKLA